MNPVLKYRGGKSREIPRFLQYIPDDFNRYIEPFFGGGAVYFYLEPENAIINDANERLIDVYKRQVRHCRHGRGCFRGNAPEDLRHGCLRG